MKKSKILVVSDDSGKILGAALPVEEPPQLSFERDTTLVTMPGQTIHETEIPPELFKHIGQASFTDELCKYQVSSDGKLICAEREGKD